jgi:parallel beta-helix repeat protein
MPLPGQGFFKKAKKEGVMSRKGLWITLLVTGVLFFQEQASADFYVINAGRRVGTEIKSLPFTINTPGFYYITGNLTSTDTGITVEADDVTIDLMGFSIIGPGNASGINYGILMENQRNVEIRNGTIRNFGNAGVRENDYNALGHRLINIKSYDNGGYGINLDSKGNVIERCMVFLNDGYGLYTGGSSVVMNCIAYDNEGHGMYVEGSSTVKDCTAYDNYNSGINVATYGTIIGNTVHSNRQNGLVAGYGSTVVANNAYDNNLYGISLVNNSLVDQNTAYSNGSAGPTYTNIDSCATCTFGTNHAP